MKELMTLAMWPPARALVGLVSLTILVCLVYSVRTSRRWALEAARTAQLAAQAAKTRAMRSVRFAPRTAELDQRRLELFLSPTKDPDIDGLSASAYIAMRDAWASLANDAIDATIEARYERERDAIQK